MIWQDRDGLRFDALVEAPNGLDWARGRNVVDDLCTDPDAMLQVACVCGTVTPIGLRAAAAEARDNWPAAEAIGTSIDL